MVYIILLFISIDDILGVINKLSYSEEKSLLFTLIYEKYTKRELYNDIYIYLRKFYKPIYLKLYEDNQLIKFEYEKDTYKFHVNDYIEIKPYYNNCKDLCIFTVYEGIYIYLYIYIL